MRSVRVSRNRETADAGGVKRPRFRGFLRAFVTNLLIAAALEYFVIPPLLSGTRVGRALEDVTLDWVIGMYAETSPRPGRVVVPFTVLDIDEETYRRWEEPLQIPRDKLLSLIRFAVDGRARLLIVDVDLSRPFDAAQDGTLKEYLEQWAGSAAPSVPVIFVRSFRETADGRNAREPRSSIVDDIAARAGNLYLAAPLFEVDTDFVIRRWRLWQPTCGHPLGDSVPSVQLLTLAILTDPAAGRTVRDSVGPIHAFACSYRLSARSSPAAPTLRFGDVTLHANPDHLQRRIVYSFPWRLGGGLARAHVDVNGQPVALLMTLPAYHVVDAPHRVSGESVAGRVVIIGGSFVEGRDIYATPVGPMPGAFLLVNSVHSLLHTHELTHLPEWVRVVILAVLTAFVTALTRRSLVRGWFPAAAIMLLVVVVGSLYLFQRSIWLEFAAPPMAAIIDHVLHALGHRIRTLLSLGRELWRGMSQ